MLLALSICNLAHPVRNRIKNKSQTINFQGIVPYEMWFSLVSDKPSNDV